MVGSYFVYTLQKLNELFDANIKIKALVRNINKLDNHIKNDSNVEVISADITKPLKKKVEWMMMLKQNIF